jgi:hypothetical protein
MAKHKKGSGELRQICPAIWIPVNCQHRHWMHFQPLEKPVFVLPMSWILHCKSICFNMFTSCIRCSSWHYWLREWIDFCCYNFLQLLQSVLNDEDNNLMLILFPSIHFVGGAPQVNLLNAYVLYGAKKSIGTYFVCFGWLIHHYLLLWECQHKRNNKAFPQSFPNNHSEIVTVCFPLCRSQPL